MFKSSLGEMFMELYRYISYELFKDMIDKKELYFVNPFKSWKDEEEGFLYRKAQEITKPKEIENSIDGSYAVKNLISKQLKNGGIYINKESNIVLDWFGMRCQSWCQEKNSFEMWKVYSYDKCAISIAVDSAKLLQLHYGKHKVEGFKVKYEDELSFNHELKKAIGRNNEFYIASILQTKRSKFSFENEYRVYVILLDGEGRYDGEKQHDGIKVKIDENMSSFINGVYCHPEATDGFKKELKEYCKEHNLKLLGI